MKAITVCTTRSQELVWRKRKRPRKKDNKNQPQKGTKFTKLFCVFCAFLWLISFLIRILLLRPRPRQSARHGVVPFMARVLKDGCSTSRYRDLDGPGLLKRGRVINRVLIQKRFGIHSFESLDDAQFLARPSKRRFSSEVRRLDDEGVALPVPARIASPLAHAWCDVRAAIERNHARVVNHFDHDRDVAGGLADPDTVVICSRHHWRTGGCPDDAAFLQGPVLRAIELVAEIRGLALPLPFLCGRGERR